MIESPQDSPNSILNITSGFPSHRVTSILSFFITQDFREKKITVTKFKVFTNYKI